MFHSVLTSNVRRRGSVVAATLIGKQRQQRQLKIVSGAVARSSNSSSTLLSCSTSCRYFSRSTVVGADLPYHIVVGMPALSPTMETGILAEWYLEEGSGFSAGDALAKIETDKASIDFEAQDDGYVAKILMEAGTGADITVGTPIMVTVEEAGDVAAFANFVVEETAAPVPAAAPVKAEEPAAVVKAATPPSPPSLPPAPASAVPAAPVVAAAPAPVPDLEMMVAALAPVMSTGWGDFAKLNSPLLKTLSKQQTEYIKKYGTTGQIPL